MLSLVDWDSVTKLRMAMQHTTGSWKCWGKFFPGNQKAVKDVPKENKNYTKRFWKRNKTSNERYKIYQTLFETLKKKSKKSYYSNLTDKYKHYMKTTWDVMKEIIGKS